MDFLVRCSDGTCQLKSYTDPAETLTISGSVGQGGKNRPDDVKSVQAALNQVPQADGGPTTPLDVDGLVGPLTIGAITRFQKKQLGWADGRVDPDKITITKLRQFQKSGVAGKASGGGGGSATPTLPRNPYVMPLIYAKLADALRWIHSAERTTTFALDLFGSGPQSLTRPTNEKAFALVNKYFHLEKLPRAMQVESLRFIHKVFTDMRMVIAHQSPDTTLGTGFFQEDPTPDNRPDGPNLAFTFFGGWHQRGKGSSPIYTGPNLRQDTVFITTETLGKKTDETFTSTIVHELAHFVGPGVNSPNRIADHSYRFKPGFFKLDAFTAIRTAECYNFLAGESFLKREPNEGNL